MNTIYNKKSYYIYKVSKNRYIVYNSKKEFKYGHTHINNYNTAKYVINLSIYNTVPNHLSKYLIESLIRISTDKTYIKKLEMSLRNF